MEPRELSGFGFDDKELTLGCDPEVFLGEAGDLIPAFYLLDDKKKNPFVFWDGFQAEFTVAPSTGPLGLAARVRAGLANTLAEARKKRPNVRFMLTDCLEIPSELLNKVSDEYVALGCDPSVNVYGDGTFLPADPRELRLRFAGGHIHFGSERARSSPERDRFAANIIMDLDKVLGVWSVAAGQGAEQLKMRRRFYGLAGEMRLPKHGFEYRTLGNFWLGHPASADLVFTMAKVIYHASLGGFMKYWLAPDEVVRHVINEYDVDQARNILTANAELFRYLLGTQIAPKAVDAALVAGMSGLETLLPKPYDVIDNWGLVNSEAPLALSWTHYANQA